jgi:prepilin-type N-terminal cleavage/methylation domain-containing protein
MNQKQSYKSGFTLLEILLVVAAIGILAGIIIVALKPSNSLDTINDAQRRSDATIILNAVYQYTIDNNGNLPSGIDSVTASSQVLGTDASGCDSTCTAETTVGACLDLSSSLVPDYIVSIPTDPSSGSSANTDYYINQDASGHLTVGSCDPQQSATISVSQ